MKREKVYNIYTKVVIILSIITIFLTVIIERENGYFWIFLIPIMYLLGFIVCKPIHIYSRKYIGIFMLNGLMFIKYILAILVIIIYRDFNTPSIYFNCPLTDNYQRAIFYMIIEMITIYFVIWLFAPKLYKNVEKCQISNEECEYKFININVVFAIFFIISIFFIVREPSSFFPKQVFFVDTDFVENEETVNYLSVIFYAFKTIVMGIIVNYCIIKYKKEKSIVYVILSYLTILVFILLATSSSRRGMILPLVLFIFITNRVFKRKGRIFLYIVIAILTTSIMAITIYKSSWKYDEDSTYSDVVVTSLEGLQEYTSNIRPIALGIEMSEKYKEKITASTFVNDIVGSIPVVNHIIKNPNDRINYYYNLYALNGDNTSQIMPMITISKTYFTSTFCWLFTAIFVILLMFAEGKKTRKSQNFLEEYMELYLLFIFVSSITSNTQMLVGRFFLNYLPILLLMLGNEKIVIKRKENKNENF